MDSFVRTHLTDHSLLRDLDSHLSLEHTATATVLADLAEVDARKLYVPAAHDSMHSYCVRELGMSKHAAFRRIDVARSGRRFPAVFRALAEGRLNLTAALLLGPHLTPETADELLAAAANRTKDEIRLLLAKRFPRPDVPTRVRAIPAQVAGEGLFELPEDAPLDQLALERVAPSETVAKPVERGPIAPRSRLAPLSPERYEWHLTVDRETQEQLQYVQSLLGRTMPSGDVPEVLKRALASLARELEKRKFAKCDRPQPQRGNAKGRHIPAAVKRKVWERDGGQCTFQSVEGQRCEARVGLEFDHAEPFARGGESTVGNLRLRCRAHNQYAADCALGSVFMQGKRQQGRERTAKAHAAAKANEQDQAHAEAEAASQEEVIPWLRALGCNVETARRAAARCAGMLGAPLEKRVRVAVQSLGPPSARRVLPAVGAPA